MIANAKQDPDVLDTWFSSALWPISTMGWPQPTRFPAEIPEGDALLRAWNPSSTLCTAREIITLWVSRMVMFNLFFTRPENCPADAAPTLRQWYEAGPHLPFRDVFIHAMIQDGEGQKMSKSLGNGVDPLDIIHSHGADAMRFTLAKLTTQTQDVKMPVDVVCPHTGQAFSPKTIRLPSGYTVAAPVQECPSDPSKKMVTGYGAASGAAHPTPQMPLARNTSTKFDEGRNFANKLWNAGRFVLTTLGEAGDVDPSNGSAASRGGSLADRWILSRLAATHRAVTESLHGYRFNEYAQSVYDFFWRDLCDWYLEAIKPVVKGDGGNGPDARATDPARATALATLAACFDATLRMLHPVMPHITEELWSHLNAAVPSRGLTGVELKPSDLLILAPWPAIDHAALVDEAIEKQFERIREVIIAIRNVRNGYNIPPRQTVDVSIHCPAEETDGMLAGRELMRTLAGCEVKGIGSGVKAAADSAHAVVGSAEVYVEGLVDAGAERERLTKRLAELEKSRTALTGRLSNPGYIAKAPPHLVEETRKTLAETEAEMERVKAKLGG